MRKTERLASGGTVLCAIYTRKSSNDGLEQEFNSLDAQREACTAYIVSQKHAGWVASPDMYDDGGLSGGNMERPALQRLLNDITAGKIRIAVVYKVDRLTRSLADFAKIVDILDAHHASFVSVTQQFNTTTSMGRLTLNMLLSFAQFEREIASERIRDKIAASKAKGMWMGGRVPLGYDVGDRKLIVNEEGAETVRLIFRRYAELGSVTVLRADLERQGIVSKRRQHADGRTSGGRPFARGALYTLLQNHTYGGQVAYKGEIYPGQHEAIVGEDLWQTVQERLNANRKARSLGADAKEPSLLAGRIIDRHGNRMTPTHANKSGKRYRYYVTTALITDKREAAPRGQRVPAGDVEALVLDRLREFFNSQIEVSDALIPFTLDAPALVATLQKAKSISDDWLSQPAIKVRALVHAIIQQVAVQEEQIVIDLDRRSIFNIVTGDDTTCQPNGMSANANSIYAVMVKARLRRAGKGMRLIVGGAVAGKPNPALISLVARAFEIREQFLSGSDDSLQSMTRRLRKTRGHLSSLVRLSYLSPKIVRVILDGEQPMELTATRLLAAATSLPVSWTEQHEALGLPRS
jgi:DNA invertase Pin-like site-specific DNA recombinase